MSIRLIDAHVHLLDDRILARSDDLINRAVTRGVLRMFCNTTSDEQWEKLVAIALRDTDITPFFGIHPWFADRAQKGWENRLAELLAARHGDAGIGEIGLDRNCQVDLALQKKVCTAQLEIGIELGLPICIHCIRSWDLLFELLEPAARSARLPGVMIHSFNGSLETMRRLTELGCFVSYSARIMNPGNKKLAEIFRQTPLDLLLLESDAPDQLYPEIEEELELATEFNEPAAVTAVYRTAAHLRGMHLQDFAPNIWNNATIFTNQTAAR